jgi:hypothetical protein
MNVSTLDQLVLVRIQVRQLLIHRLFGSKTRNVGEALLVPLLATLASLGDTPGGALDLVA